MIVYVNLFTFASSIINGYVDHSWFVAKLLGILGCCRSNEFGVQLFFHQIDGAAAKATPITRDPVTPHLFASSLRKSNSSQLTS